MLNVTDMLLRQVDGSSGSAFLRAPAALANKASEFVGTVLPLGNQQLLKNMAITGILLLLVLVSALGVIYSSHLSRQLFSEQAVMNEKTDQLQLEWAQLLLEQSAWSSPTRIETIARDQLGMVMPEAAQIKLID